MLTFDSKIILLSFSISENGHYHLIFKNIVKNKYFANKNGYSKRLIEVMKTNKDIQELNKQALLYSNDLGAIIQ